MLLTKEVEVKWHPTNIKYYTSRGYIYTKTKESFTVNIEDLAPNSHSRVTAQCDYCGEKYEISYYHYSDKNRLKTTHKDACTICKNKKGRETYRSIYGVDVPAQNKEVMEVIASKKRKDFNIIKSEFTKRGYLLLSREYKNNVQKLEYICPIHKDKGVLTITWGDFQSQKGCKYCGIDKNIERFTTDFSVIQEKFEERGYELISTSYSSGEKLKYKCPNHPDDGIIEISLAKFNMGQGCNKCGYERTRGENNPNWSGGVTTTINYFRSSLTKWIKDSAKNCNYKCVITGKRFDDIHHLYNYNSIVREAFDSLGIELYDKYTAYTYEQLDVLKDKILELHYKYGYGVCLTKEVHYLYHSIYGNKRNTPEQFEEFKTNYLNGKYNLIKD